MEQLNKKTCTPCEGGVPPLSADQIETLRRALSGDWHNSGSKKIERTFLFKNFSEAIDFVSRVADIAEREGHHPDIHIHYNKVRIELWTHAIGGLSENDFILAAKIDQL